MKLKAKIYKADTPNANGYIYPADVLEKAVAEYNKKQRYALGGEYPPDGNLNDLPVDKMLGEAKLEFDGEYVVATVEALNTKTAAIKEAVSGCPDNIKIMPIAQVANESVNADGGMSVSHIVCTCQDVDVGDAEEDMYIAQVIVDES